MSVELRRVADLAEQVRGVSYSKADASLEPQEGYVPILRAGNISDSGLKFDDLVYVPKAKVKGKQLVRANDIVIAASSGSLDIVGKAARALNDFHGGFGAFCKVLRPAKDIEPSYFAHYFKTNEYRRKVSSLAAGANINNLRNGDLDELLIPVPSLKEQKRIAKILDAADALRAKRRESLAQLDALLRSAFLDLFGDPVSNPMGWDELPLEEIVLETKIGLVRSSKEFGWGFTTPYVRMDAVSKDGNFLFDKVQFTEATEKEIDVYSLRPGDFLFNTRNSKELVGKSCVYSGPEGWLFNNNLMRIRFVDGVRSEVIAAQFHFPRIAKELEQRKSGTTSVFAVYWKNLKSLPVLIPPKDIQYRYAALVRSVNKEAEQLKCHLKELDALFYSLQQRAFSGEL